MSSVTANVVLALAAIPLVRNRPRNPIGWLLLAGGVAHGVVAATGYWTASWIAGVAVPIALLLFPFGRLRSRVWRPALAIFAPVLIAAYLTALYVAIGVAAVVVAGSLATRYHRGDEVVRRQVLWLVLAIAGFKSSQSVRLDLSSSRTTSVAVRAGLICTTRCAPC